MSRVPNLKRAKFRHRFFIDPQSLTLGNVIVGGTHKIVLGRKINDSSKQHSFPLKEQKWVLKDADNKLCAQIEAGITALYATFKSDGVPKKTRAVYPDNDSDAYQVASTYIDGFRPLTTENINSLVDHGLPEALALSYFFEEEDLKKDNIGTTKDGKVVRLDMGRSAFGFLLQKNLVSARLNHTTVFSVTANDIDHFPVLIDADPYYFPTKYRYVSSDNGYTQAEVDAFSAFKDNVKFREKSYCQFLKIGLTPHDVFKKILADHIEEPELSELVAYFVLRQQALRTALLQSNQFKKIWRGWSCQLFEMNADYLQFCTQMLKQEFEESITALSMVSLQGANAFQACYQACFEKKTITEDDIIALIQQAESVLFSLKDDEKCTYAVDALKKNMLQLKQHGLLDAQKLSVRKFVASDDAFVEVPSLSQEALVKGIVTWMTDNQNKATVLHLFNQVCDQYAAENASYLSYAASYIGSYFFASQQIYRPVAEFKKFSNQIMEAKDGDALCTTMSYLLCETGDDAKMIHRYFMKALVERYSVEFSRSHIFKQIKQHPGFAYYLQSQPKQQLPEDRVLSLVPLLIQALEPDSQPLLRIGEEEEWMSVSHNTAPRFSEDSRKEDDGVQATLPTQPTHITQATSTCNLDTSTVN